MIPSMIVATNPYQPHYSSLRTLTPMIASLSTLIFHENYSQHLAVGQNHPWRTILNHFPHYW